MIRRYGIAFRLLLALADSATAVALLVLVLALRFGPAFLRSEVESPFTDPLIAIGPGADLADEVVDLAAGGPHHDLGVDQTGGTHDLLGDLRGHLDLVRARRRRQEHDLVHRLRELLEAERAVVHRGREPESVFDQRLLAGAVTFELPVELRHGDV